MALFIALNGVYTMTHIRRTCTPSGTTYMFAVACTPHKHVVFSMHTVTPSINSVNIHELIIHVTDLSDVCLKCTCSLDTSAFSALEVLDDYCAISHHHSTAGRGGLVVGRPTAVREDPGSNLTAAGRVYHDSHCDIQP